MHKYITTYYCINDQRRGWENVFTFFIIPPTRRKDSKLLFFMGKQGRMNNIKVVDYIRIRL